MPYDHAALERAAKVLADLHPAWRGRRWEDIGENARQLFIEDAQRVALALEGSNP